MDKAEKRKVEQAAIDTVLQEGIDFFVDIKNPTFWHKVRIKKKSKLFVIKPIVMGTLARITRICVDIDLMNEISKKDFMKHGVETMAKHTDNLLNIVALAISNNDKPLDKKLATFLRKNITPLEVLNLLTYVIAQLNTSPFMKSIRSAKSGMSLSNLEE